MKIGRVLKTVYAVAVLAAFVLSPAVFSRAWAADDTRDFVREVKLFETVANYVRLNYVKEVDATDLLHAAIRGLISQLDVYTAFLEADDFRLLLNDTEGSFGGLGIEIAVTPEDQTLTVMNVLEGMPAERVGLQPRDKIVEIEGKSTEGITTRDALVKLRGDPGTAVSLAVVRKDYPEKLSFTITREVIHMDTVPYHFMAGKDVGYIRVTMFARDQSRSTTRDFEKALAELQAQGAKKLIIDLRGNPGGALDEAVAMSSLFLKKGSLVVYTKGRSHRWEDRRYFAEQDPKWKKIPLVVLVDDTSASASEIFTGAMKDQKRAIIMGKKTYGKASVQTLIPLSSAADQEPGPGLKITVAYYYTPAGNLIDGKGIEPDVPLEPEKVALISAKLYVDGLFRMYAEKYHDEHGETAPDDFAADPRAFADFKEWVNGRDFAFYPKEYADTLPDGGREFYLAAMDKEQKTIMSILTREVIREVKGDAAAYKFWREYDPWVSAAVDKLS